MRVVLCLFFFNDTATTEIYTLSLHDALPIYQHDLGLEGGGDAARFHCAERRPGRQIPGVVRTGERHADVFPGGHQLTVRGGGGGDRKSTRLNSSHANISYAVFCLKKKPPPMQ